MPPTRQTAHHDGFLIKNYLLRFFSTLCSQFGYLFFFFPKLLILWLFEFFDEFHYLIEILPLHRRYFDSFDVKLMKHFLHHRNWTEIIIVYLSVNFITDVHVNHCWIYILYRNGRMLWLKIRDLIKCNDLVKLWIIVMWNNQSNIGQICEVIILFCYILFYFVILITLILNWVTLLLLYTVSFLVIS
jgi:hypothetical protein